jgi:hypothetical protein
MTKNEALREISDELGISISKCVGILEALFESPIYIENNLCAEYELSYDNVSVGKLIFRKFVKLAGDRGLLQRRTMYCLPADREYTKQEIGQYLRESLSLPVEQKSVSVATKTKDAMVTAEAAELCVLEAQELMDKSWFPEKMKRLGAMLAADNKSGKMKLRRVINLMYEPLVKAQEKYTREALEYGIDQSIMQSAPNPNYVKKCARSYMDRNGQRTPALDIKSDIIITDDGRQIGKYDTWALNDERYREKFIEVFGGL